MSKIKEIKRTIIAIRMITIGTNTVTVAIFKGLDSLVNKENLEVMNQFIQTRQYMLQDLYFLSSMNDRMNIYAVNAILRACKKAPVTKFDNVSKVMNILESCVNKEINVRMHINTRLKMPTVYDIE